MLRYGVRELLLVQPGAARHRSPPPQDDPGVAEALARAARDRAAGRTFDDWSDDDKRAWFARPRAVDMASVYGNALTPAAMTAPAPWPAEIALLTGEALVAAAAGRLTPFRPTALPWLPVIATWALGVGWARTRLEHRQARSIGLTPATAPLPVTGTYPVMLIAAFAGETAWRRLAKGRSEPYPWMLENAANAIRTLNRRRSWHAAYTAASTRRTRAPSSGRVSPT